MQEEHHEQSIATGWPSLLPPPGSNCLEIPSCPSIWCRCHCWVPCCHCSSCLMCCIEPHSSYHRACVQCSKLSGLKVYQEDTTQLDVSPCEETKGQKQLLSRSKLDVVEKQSNLVNNLLGLLEIQWSWSEFVWAFTYVAVKTRTPSLCVPTSKKPETSKSLGRFTF